MPEAVVGFLGGRGVRLRGVGQRLAALTATAADSAVEPGAPVTPRVAAAIAESRDRTRRHAARLRPVLWIMLVVVLLASLYGQPRPGLSGTRLGITLSLAGICLLLGLNAVDVWPLSRPWLRIVFPAATGVCGLVLEALQPMSASTMPTSGSVFIAVMLLPTLVGAAIASTLTVALMAVVWSVPNGSAQVAAAELVFCVVLGVTAFSLRQAGESQSRAEILLAQLADAREAEAKAVAVAERTRIARELHDVLAQSLSGLAIQLEAARRMARREEVGEQLQAVLDRSGGLVKEGLDDARRAVGALRGSPTPVLDRLPELVERFQTDHHVKVRLSVEGTPRDLPSDVGLALYRGAQEALTNVSRYARGSQSTVTLWYRAATVVLTVTDSGENRDAAAGATAGATVGATDERSGPPQGSGMGLIGMRERLAQVGGTAVAGPAEGGWTVRMEVAA